jgi:CYTH domain-containing protein
MSGKYAQVERERRFLLHGIPADQQATAARRIADRYLTGTRLRLRLRHVLGDDDHDYKLTQKIPAAHPGPSQGLITTIYLSKAEYDLLAGLPGKTLTKTRHSIPPLSIDVFDPPFHGLVLAEAEFATDAQMLAFQPPHYAVAEVTNDPHFTGGHLADSTRRELTSWLSNYGISLATTSSAAGRKNEPMAGLPELDIARGRRWCEERVPVQVRDQVRVECEVAPRYLTIVERRPPLRDGTGQEWTRFPIARLRYTQASRTWSLYWRDRNLRFHRYDQLPPSPHIDVLLQEVDRDPTALFWG